MYTVLLADDELPILETLQTTIPWQQFGIDSLLTAQDGLQAWELIQKQQVDLLITDIRMPHMDGMELLEKIRASYPHIHCILLTAYGEFEYARTAIKLGVENYLLKPFQKDEMEETIEKALDNIYTQRGNSNQLFNNNILLRWAAGSISPEELSERSSLLDINIYLSRYCAVCVKRKQKTGSLSAYRAACQEELSKNYEIYRFRDDKDRIFFIIGGSNLSQEEIAGRFISIARQHKVESLLVLTIGSVVQDSSSLSQSYQSACALLESSDLSHSDMIVLTSSQVPPVENDLLSKVLLSLFHQESEELRVEGYQKLADELIRGALPREGHMLLSGLAHSLSQLFAQEFPKQSGIQDQIYSRIHLLSAAAAHDNPALAVTELLEYSYLLFHFYFKQLSPVIQYAIDYIHKHYAESLSIKEFCVRNKMSTNYLGFLFKKETGMFFNNYLTQYRICCSIQLLRDSDKKISDIAQKTGFSSTSYYISCFKKQTGLSPIKYRSLQFDISF